METINYGSADFVVALKGTIVSSHPPGEHVTTDSAPAPPHEEFSRFEELTGKLVNVPKEELDEKRETKQ